MGIVFLLTVNQLLHHIHQDLFLVRIRNAQVGKPMNSQHFHVQKLIVYSIVVCMCVFNHVRLFSCSLFLSH